LLIPKTNAEKVKELSNDSLNTYKGYFTTIQAIRDLESNEKELLTAIENKLSGKTPDETPQPQQVDDLDLASLKTILGNDDLSDTELKN